MIGNEELVPTELFSTISLGSRWMVGPSARFNF
jgi:hypothetical protein